MERKAAMKISEITRRDIFDAILLEEIDWAGRLNDVEFLSRLFNLSELPSTDHRFSDAARDIRQHRVNNFDWENHWVFDDRRLNLLNCDDELFLRFLCETIHPVVRPDIAEAEQLCHLYNRFLEKDGFQLIEKMRISDRPIFVGRYVGIGIPGVSAAKEALLNGSDITYVMQQITRMETAVNSDPGLAIGTAKELIETCCKTILHERNVKIPSGSNIPRLVKLTSKELKLTPDDIEDQARAAETIKHLLSNLAAITQGIAELRNDYGTGHGKTAKTKGLDSRHARLAVGVASTLAVFLVETHRARRNEH
uniref:Abortive infection C-terminus n=1 Tax=Candidatus Kentrum sp. FM TaxID=2126340 RepID=A0A450T5K1_9GAMM|nr:MAG: Abortive infection C-terminus [Candidatus Kentron sp. FM]VFJ61926.1 MAG: Abortive infection C-terminus [Candidatus Kentron sp. FM]VFK12834.1 MAG: Abortive infection C-terminus [Candidatus Kentron sp. FM]